MAVGPAGLFNVSASGLIDSGRPRIFKGFSFKCTAGAPAEVEIRDGSAGGLYICGGSLAAVGHSVPLLVDEGIAVAGGVYVNIVSGTVTVAVWVD